MPQNFLDLLGEQMQKPMFQMGAGLFSSASNGEDIGTGLLAGTRAAGQATKQQQEMMAYRKKQEAEQRLQEMWAKLSQGGQPPEWAKALPPGMLDMAMSMGPEQGSQLVTQMMLKNADRDLDVRRLDADEKYKRESLAIERQKLAQGGEKVLTPQDRAAVAQRYGIGPDHPAYKSYVLTGKMPREDQQPLSRTEKEQISESDEMVRSSDQSIASLEHALKLSPDANAGWFARGRAALANNLPDAAVPDFISSPKSAAATSDLDNTVVANALASMKAIFGGNPTEGERGILLEIQGSANQPRAVREDIYKRAVAMARQKRGFHELRAQELRGGEYYKPDRGQGGQPLGAPQQQQPAPGQPQQSKVINGVSYHMIDGQWYQE